MCRKNRARSLFVCSLSPRGFLVLLFCRRRRVPAPPRFGGIGVKKNELYESSRIAFFFWIDRNCGKEKERNKKEEEENESLTMPTPAIVMVVSGFGKDGIFTCLCCVCVCVLFIINEENSVKEDNF